MTVVINSNTAANVAARNLSKANDALRKSLARLSSGNRINSAMDDAGGLSVAYKINSRLGRLEANNQNIQNGTSFLQVQEGALKNAAEIVSRMSELRTMAADITKNDSDIQNYNYEFRELQKELNSLRGQKFNGVSLFGSLASGSENLTLDISDDGTGAGVEISRIGLFENLKSKFGADGELNSGSHGSYRQLVGDFVTDAGILDASPGYATRNYSKGSVVYRNGPTDAESGYFMALKDVMSGASIEDTLGTSSNWIRVADRSGNGFSELYSDSPVYDQNNVKFNSDGEPVAYLKGDIVKVQAHWADDNGFIYLKANSDVPRNQTMDSILSEGLGKNALFDYISVNRSGDVDGRPTTEFLRQNASAPTASLFNPSSSASFLNLLSYHGANNNYTPGHIRVDVADDPFLNGSVGSSSPVSVTANKQEDTITDILGGSQVKQIDFDNIFGDKNDVFQIEVTINGVTHNRSFAFAGESTKAGSVSLATGILDQIKSVKLEDGSDAFDDTNSLVRSSADGVSGFNVLGTTGAGDFSISITPFDDAENFDPTQVYEVGARVLEMESTSSLGNIGGVHNFGPSTHPLNSTTPQLVTYEFAKKFWADGSTISAVNQVSADDLAFDGVNFYKALKASDSSDFTLTSIWNPLGGTNLMQLENFWAGSSVNLPVANDDDDAGAFVASVRDVTVKHEYIADKIGVQIVSQGVTYNKQVDFISGANVSLSASLSATALAEAINADTTGIGAVVVAEVINNKEIKLTAQASGIPFTTSAITSDDHTSSNATHANPAGNGHPGGTTPASLTINTTKEIEAPTAPGASASSATGYSIFKPASDWGIKEWDSSYPHQNGSLVWNVNSGTGNPEIWELGTNVKGFWNGGTVQSGEIFLHNGSWYQAQSNNLTETPDSSSLNWTLVDPLLVGATDVTADYMDLSNTNLWSKTHFGNLIGTTIEQDYVRGDNFFYEGKHYVYVSSSPSSDYKYDPTQTGLTEFEVLLEEGAVMELPIYVDTVGRGGSPDLPEGVYYKPNQNLEYIDRLPDSGLVRTNSIERRGEPSDSDNIYNSNDDLYYGGLNPGADGIYGTNDDVYATTRYSEFAKAGGHIDSDADNNKDLLNESNNLTDFSVMDFVDFIQTIANFRAINGGSMSRLEYAGRMLAENRSNLEAAYGRIMDADIAMESSRFAKHNVMVQASASMVAQANQLTNVALTLLGR